MKLTLRSRVLGPMLGTLTEAVDFVDAIWDSLDWRLQRKLRAENRQRTLQQKLRELWEHYDKINVHDAIKNLVVNQVIDFAVGQAMRRGHDYYFRGWEELGIEGPLVGPTFGEAAKRYLRDGLQTQERKIPERQQAQTSRRLPGTAVDALFYR